MLPRNPRPAPAPRIRMNNLIRAPEVRVIGEDGAQLGIMPTHQAIERALSLGLDLVEVGSTATPPIAKIMDYGKYMYQKERKEKGEKSAANEIKTVKIGYRTGDHDLAVRAAQIDKFLSKKYRVRVELMLRGREKGMKEIATAKLQSFLAFIAEPHAIDAPLRALPNNISLTLRPGK